MRKTLIILMVIGMLLCGNGCLPGWWAGATTLGVMCGIGIGIAVAPAGDNNGSNENTGQTVSDPNEIPCGG